MQINHHFSTVFGCELDLDIGAALAHGMSLEVIYAELSARTSEIADAIHQKRMREEAEKCAA